MAFTLQTLLGADPGRVHAAAEAWLAMAGDLDDACEDLIRGSRDLPDAWPLGPAAEAAQRANRDLLAEAGNAEPPARRIGQALRTHADTVRSLQDLARQIAAEATGRGFVVDLAAGTVAVGAAPASDSSGGQQSAQAISSYVQQLQSIVERAASLDSSTMTAIQVNLPNARTGFGTGQQQNVSRTDLEAQARRTPAEIKGWWDSLTPQQQEQAILEFPGLVGAMNGIPVADRDTANRFVLRRETDGYEQRISSIDARLLYLQRMYDQGRIGEVYPDASDPRTSMDTEMLKLGVQRSDDEAKLGGLEVIGSRLHDPGKPDAYLMGLSTADDGRAIVAVGNPDTSDNVVTYVPGTTSDLPGIETDLKRADTMAYDANTIDSSGRTTASILWLGYDAPDMIPNAGSSSYATNAVDDLQNFQSGLGATHDGRPSHNTVLGHSYGTTTVGYAARDGNGLAANDLIFVGSPGVGVDSASGLHIQGDHNNVWASTAANDVIRLTGVEDTMRFGENPDNPGFGGRQFTSADGSWSPVATHSEYWDPHNPSRKNIAFIITGQTDRVH
ncbi:alpha/beta hydrolase [Actinoplanes sp. NPDC026623]|uniref:alpha/beta hydrolase n=1 Tax=Actinoplanes sp. NPDC026623 TaxID=3155610 RepID=UPI0033F7AE8D